MAAVEIERLEQLLMKRKLTNAQMQESIAELTDEVTELKAEGQKANAWREGADRQFDTIFEALDQASETIRQTAINQLRYEQQANERMMRVEATVQRVSDNQKLADERLTRLEKTVQKLSNTVDRYLAARLNGGSKN